MNITLKQSVTGITIMVTMAALMPFAPAHAQEEQPSVCNNIEDLRAKLTNRITTRNDRFIGQLETRLDTFIQQQTEQAPSVELNDDAVARLMDFVKTDKKQRAVEDYVREIEQIQAELDQANQRVVTPFKQQVNQEWSEYKSKRAADLTRYEQAMTQGIDLVEEQCGRTTNHEMVKRILERAVEDANKTWASSNMNALSDLNSDIIRLTAEFNKAIKPTIDELEPSIRTAKQELKDMIGSFEHVVEPPEAKQKQVSPETNQDTEEAATPEEEPKPETSSQELEETTEEN